MSDDDEPIDLVEILDAIGKRKRLVFGLPLASAAIAAAVSLLLPTYYTATARILPPQQTSSSSLALLGELAGIVPGTGGVAGTLGLKNPGELYVGMLRSRTVADHLLQRYELRQVYGEVLQSEARTRLEAETDVRNGRDGIITISYTDRDPKRAAAIANSYVEELTKLTQTLAVTEASQRRLFFDRQLDKERGLLADAEIALKRTQERTGLIKLDEQGRAIVEAVARLRAEIAAKEVQLGAMRLFATEQNPDYLRTQEELAGLRMQLSNVEQSHPEKRGDIIVAAGNVPESSLEYVRRLREVKYHETLYELLAKQLEIAKIDEAREGSVIQVVDPALPPDRKSRPQRTLIVVVTAVLAGLVGLIWAFAAQALQRARARPGFEARLTSLLATWSLRPRR
jgi:uncharacterized protein involved in exopolysaccharide biosynthesis